MKKIFKGLTRDTFLLAFASLFSDISTEMLYPVLPTFLTDVLKAPASIIGIVEGIATATQYGIQGFSGFLSDKFKKRKPIALFGYVLAALAKPFIGFSGNWIQVATGRFTDRLGAGIRSAPRDALIAASANEKNRGKAFGLEGIGDNAGAFIGPLIAIALLFLVHVPIRWIFYLAFIPGLLAAGMILFVKERRSEGATRVEGLPTARSPQAPQSAGRALTGGKPGAGPRAIFVTKFPKSYWKYLFVTALFGLGNSSNAFLILRTKQIGIPLVITIFIYALFNLVAAISSYPAGHLSDIFGRKNILLATFGIFIITYLGFALTTNYIFLAALFMLYGIFSGTFRAVGKAYASDFVPQQQRAGAIGWYSTTIGITGLVASIIAGQLWVFVSPQAAFMFGALFAVAGFIALLLLF